MKVNDKYILCQVEGYFSEEDKKSELREEAIFVFDWNLKPIKKFEWPAPEEKSGCYTISNDGNSVYFCEYNEECITKKVSTKNNLLPKVGRINKKIMLREFGIVPDSFLLV